MLINKAEGGRQKAEGMKARFNHGVARGLHRGARFKIIRDEVQSSKFKVQGLRIM
jgi:hypothetical protein